MLTLSPSGDTTGATDVTAINAALATDDVQLSSSGTWYIRSDANGFGIQIPAGRTLQGPSSASKASLYLAGTLSSTRLCGLISGQTGANSGKAKNIIVRNLILDGGRNGIQSTAMSFTSGTKTIALSTGLFTNRGIAQGDTITVAGTASNNGNYTVATISASSIVVNESLVTEAAGATMFLYKSTANGCMNGGNIVFAGQNDYGNNNILIENVISNNAPVQQWQINSCDGVTFNNCTSYADKYPTASGHGCDFDSVAYDKPSKNIYHNNCTMGSFGQECLKYENTEGATNTSCTYNDYVTLTQDPDIPYSSISGVAFRSCTFNSWVALAYLKRRHTPSGSTSSSTPAATLTLGSAAPGTGIAVTASAGVFSSGDVNKAIIKTQNSINGMAIITGFTSSTSVTVTIVTKFDSTSVTSGWTLAATDNSGSGDVSFIGCSFVGDDASIIGIDNSAVDYGTITITDCSFTGRNNYFFPSAVSPTLSGNTGVVSNKTIWVRNTVSARYQNVFGTSGGMLGLVKSYGFTAAPTPISNFASAVYDGYSFANSVITWVNGTYVTAFFSGHTNGNVNIAFSIAAESYLGVTIDGTGSTGAFFGYSGTNTSLVTIDGFLIQNFTGGSSTKGISVNAASALFTIKNCKIVNCTCTNGGGGIRLQNYGGVGTIQNVWFLNCTVSGTTHGGGLLVDVGGVTVKSCRFEGCQTTGTGTGGGARVSYSTAAITSFYGCEFVNCASGSTGGGLAFFNSTSNPDIRVVNCTFANNTAVTSAPDYTVNLSGTATGSVKNCIMYSTGVPLVKAGVGTLTTTYSDIRGGFAGTGNVDVDPLFVDFANRYYNLSLASPVKYAGSYDASSVDRRGNLFMNPPTMGAWEFIASRGKSGRLSVGLTQAGYKARILR